MVEPLVERSILCHLSTEGMGLVGQGSGCVPGLYAGGEELQMVEGLLQAAQILDADSWRFRCRMTLSARAAETTHATTGRLLVGGQFI